MRLRFQLKGVRCFVENEYECARGAPCVEDGRMQEIAPFCAECAGLRTSIFLRDCECTGTNQHGG